MIIKAVKNRSVLRVEAKEFSFLEKSEKTEFSQAISKYDNYPPEDKRIQRQISFLLPKHSKAAIMYIHIAYSTLTLSTHMPNPEISWKKANTHLPANSSSPRTVHASAPTRGLDQK